MNNLFFKNTSNQMKDSYKSKRENILKDLNNSINYNKNDKNINNYLPQNIPLNTRNNISINADNLDYSKLVSNLKQNSFSENINTQPHPKFLHKKKIRNGNKDDQPKIVSYSQITNSDKKFDSSYKMSNNQIYVAEIGDKRKLSNLIYNGIISSLKNSKNSITEYDIDILLNKLNLSKEKWKKKDTQKFVEELRKIINLKKYNNILPNFGEQNDLFEKETKEKVYYITIDSNDRNEKKWPNPNNFQIQFEPNSFSNKEESTGFINKSFNNVKSVELIQAIIPNGSNNGDNYDILPYILLEIEELGSIYQGTNDFISNTFSKLIFDKIIGSYRYSFSNCSIEKVFNPRIAINKFTIKFRKPNGELYNFGKYILNNNIEEKKKIKTNNILTFKITCIIKSLDTMFLNKKH